MVPRGAPARSAVNCGVVRDGIGQTLRSSSPTIAFTQRSKRARPFSAVAIVGRPKTPREPAGAVGMRCRIYLRALPELGV